MSYYTSNVTALLVEDSSTAVLWRQTACSVGVLVNQTETLKQPRPKNNTHTRTNPFLFLLTSWRCLASLPDIHIRLHHAEESPFDGRQHEHEPTVPLILFLSV